MTENYDVAVIGAGLIGASAACHLSEHCKVVLIEQEPQPGYHSSGRSAAVLLPHYGGPVARALTAASVGFLSNPPEAFAAYSILSPRGCLFLATEDQRASLDAWLPPPGANVDTARFVTPAEATRYVPILKPELIAAAVFVPAVTDIDAAALLQGFVQTLRARGGVTRLNQAMLSATRDDGVWTIQTSSCKLRARILINAAGAWADDIAAMAGARPCALTPTRRTMIVIQPPAELDVRTWPLVADAGETLYFKPDGGRLTVSPADRTTVAAQDVQPEEWDVAVAVERLESVTTLQVRRVEHQWAGLRTFAPDEEPIVGFDPQVPDFMWAAGFGGFGVQAAPAAGRCAASLILHGQLPDDLARLGVDAQQLSPRRFVTDPSGS